MTQPETVAATRLLLAQLGISPEELVAAATGRTADAPTVAEFYEVVGANAAPGTRGTYGLHWRRLVAALGDRPVTTVRTSDLRTIVTTAKQDATARANSRQGRGAQENCVGALRHFFARVVEDGYRKDNPAEPIDKPRRQASHRRPLTSKELAELWDVSISTGDDPHLDGLLHRFHLETGARRGGALALRRKDIDREQQVILLREKGETERWQPVSLTLVDALLAHADARGATRPDDQALRFKPRRGQDVGAPLTRRRYNTLAERWQRNVAWAGRQHVSVHWLRHTAVATVERLAGFGVARRFAGHTDESAATTITYLRAADADVAAAVSLMTGEPHPLAPAALLATEAMEAH